MDVFTACREFNPTGGAPFSQRQLPPIEPSPIQLSQIQLSQIQLSQIQLSQIQLGEGSYRHVVKERIERSESKVTNRYAISNGGGPGYPQRPP